MRAAGATKSADTSSNTATKEEVNRCFNLPRVSHFSSIIEAAVTLMNHKILFGLLGVLIAASPVFGGLGGPHSLLDLEQSADLIVVATASGSFLAGAATNFSLHVSRVVSGDPTLADSTLAVSWAARNQAMAPAGTTETASGTGLWFLKHSSSTWLVLPVLDGSMSVSITFFPAPVGPILSAYAYSPTASLSDKVDVGNMRRN
jgi:hypothetical protein